MLFIIVFLLCFYSLGKKNPWKWFWKTRMKSKNPTDEDLKE